MKHASQNRKMRNRNNRGGNARVQVYDSNGPDVRIRGTAHQVHEKYLNLAKDAASAGDRVMAESYLQHAEHYQRVISGWHDYVDDFQFETYADDSDTEERGRTRGRHQKQNQNRNQDHNDDLGLPDSVLKPASSEAQTEKELA